MHFNDAKAAWKTISKINIVIWRQAFEWQWCENPVKFGEIIISLAALVLNYMSLGLLSLVLYVLIVFVFQFFQISPVN